MVLFGGDVTSIFFPCRSMGAVMLNGTSTFGQALEQ